MPETVSCPQHIIHAAATLFQEQGYDDTTLAQIACAAAIPIDDLNCLAYSKIEITLALYHHIGQELWQTLSAHESDSIAQSYFYMLEEKIRRMEAHNDAIAALFATAMRRNAAISSADIAPGRSDIMMTICERIVHDASDCPVSAMDCDNMALLLYTFQFLVMIFWLYDRTDKCKATHLLIEFLREFVRVTRPMLMMPLFSKAMTRMATILMLVFGGARLVTPSDQS